MITPRENHCAAVLKGKIYVAGGMTVESFSDCISDPVTGKVECFDPVTGKWTAVTRMNTPRSSHGLVSAGGKLYAIGGVNDLRNALCDVECFDPLTREWSNIKPLEHARNEPVVAVLGDKLYAIGGEPFTHNNVEYLDLSNPNQWITVASTIPKNLYCVGAVVTGKKIYVVGEDTFGTMNKIIYCFDPITEQWTIVDETYEFSSNAVFSAC